MAKKILFDDGSAFNEETGEFERVQSSSSPARHIEPPPPPQNSVPWRTEYDREDRTKVITRITGIIIGVAIAFISLRIVKGDDLAIALVVGIGRGQMFLRLGIAIFGITLALLAIFNAMEKRGVGIFIGVIVGLVAGALISVRGIILFIVGGTVIDYIASILQQSIPFGIGGVVIGAITGYIALRMTAHWVLSALAAAALIIGIVLSGPSKIIPATEAAEQTFAVDVRSENGVAKIFQIHYGKEETVISIIRTTGSHKAIGIAKPGKANSFFVKEADSEKTWPLKETRSQDYEEAAGVELVFDPFESRSFDLIEGNDTSDTAWHFRNVTATAADKQERP